MASPNDLYTPVNQPNFSTMSGQQVYTQPNPNTTTVNSEQVYTPPPKSLTVLTSNEAKKNYSDMNNFANQESARVNANLTQAQIQNAQDRQAQELKDLQEAGIDTQNKTAEELAKAREALFHVGTPGAAGATGSTTPPATYDPNKPVSETNKPEGTAFVNGQLTYVGNTASNTTGSTGPAPVPGSPEDIRAKAQARIDAENKAYEDNKTALANAASGATLTPEQKAQLDVLTQQYDRLKRQQDEANKTLEGATVMETIRSGTSRYAYGYAAGRIQNTIEQGTQRLADLESKKQGALLQMRQAFISDNVKGVQAAYDAYQAHVKSTNDIITKMNDDVIAINKAAADAKQKAFEDQKTAQTFALEHDINTAFYKVGNTIFDSATLMPVTLEDYKKVTGTDKFDSRFVSTPANKLKSSDTQIVTVNGRVQLRNKITGELIKDMGSSKSGSGSGKAPARADVTKYDLPSWVTKQEFDYVRNQLMEVRKNSGSLNLSEAERNKLWGDSAAQLQAAGYDPSDFDALLWEAYSPKGLAGYRQYVQNVKPKASLKEQITKMLASGQWGAPASNPNE